MRRWAEPFAAAALLAAAAGPLWAGRFLPLLDLPQHLALANVIAHYGDRAARFAEYYVVRSDLDPYWGYYAAMHLLGFLLPVEAANRVLLTGYAVALPVTVGYALSSLGRDWRWAVFSLPFVFHTSFFWGFATFLLSMPVFFLALGLAARHLAAEKADPARSLRLAAAAALLYLCHAQTYLLLGPCILLLLAVSWRGAGWAARRSFAFVPSLALFLAWCWRSFVRPHASRPVGHTAEWRNYGSLSGLGARFDPLGEVLARMPERLLGAFSDGSESWILAVFGILFLVAVAICRFPEANAGEVPSSRSKPGLASVAFDHRGELLAVVLLCAYLFVPVQVAGQFYLNQRHLVFAVLLAPAFLVAPAKGLRRWLLVPAAALSLGALANTGFKIAAFQEQVGPFQELVAEMEPGRRLMSLIFDNGAAGPVRLWPLLHFGCYYQVLRGGDVSFSFAGLPSIPVAYRRGMQAPHPYEWRPQDFRWETMGPSYDYFLIRGRPLGDAARLAEHAVLLRKAGDWQLWGRRG